VRGTGRDVFLLAVVVHLTVEAQGGA
jgi:hypothetical protein